MKQLAAGPLTAIALAVIASGAARSATGGSDVPDYGEPIIVTGIRPPNPSLLGDVQPIDGLSQRDVADFAVNSISELLSELSARLAAGGDGAPLVLLNGRRVFNLGEAASLPTESIRRVDILPAPVGLRFGGNASQKVVNFVLRPRHRSASASVGGGLATEGHGNNGELGGTLSRLKGGNRFSLSARAYTSRRLLESERDIVQPPDSASDEGRFRTLSPSERRYTLNGTLARQLSRSWNASLNAGANYETSHRLLGLPYELAAVGNMNDPLSRRTRNLGAFAALKANADLKHWSLAGTAEYGRRTSNTLAELRPLTLESPGVRTSRLTERARSRTDNAGMTFVASGPLFKVPAGRLRASLYGDLARSSLESRRSRAGTTKTAHRSRTDAGAWLNAEAPITKGSSGSVLRGLQAHFKAGLRSVSDVGTLRSYSYGIAWTPARVVNLNASVKKDRQPPSLLQLASPTIDTSGVRAFDYLRGETVEVTEIIGGNPALRPDRRGTFAVGVNVGPVAGKLRLSADYKRLRIDNPIAALPAATTAVQAAFPERFVRDSSGTLVGIDSRLVDFERQDLKQLHWGAAWRYGGERSAGRVSSASGEDKDGADGSDLRLRLSLDHTLVLKDKILLRHGLPALDLLEGDAIGPYGGQPRHQLQWEAGASRAGVGARIIGKWQSATTVTDAGAAEFLHFSPLTQHELRFNTELDSMLPKSAWARRVRLTVSIANLLDQKQKVRDSSGRTPLIYQRDYLDPLGRTVSVSLRKTLADAA